MRLSSPRLNPSCSVFLIGETRGINLYNGSGLFGTGMLKFLHAETMFLSQALGHSKTNASSGSSNRMNLPSSLVPSRVRSLKEFSTKGWSGEVRIFALPVIIILFFVSNSILRSFGTSTTGACLLAVFQVLPDNTAPSSKSRRDLTLRRRALATRRLRPSSSNADSSMSSVVKEHFKVIVNGSKMSGPPGVICFTSGTAPNKRRLRSNLRSESTIEPSPFDIELIIDGSFDIS
mmetsp:Transcript_14092/g.21124  ORF Transcript_14092/g.21124 Transcript_14092/m.21124 type:complete len:233 (-) Transcript_14092:1874-2572(-)